MQNLHTSALMNHFWSLSDIECSTCQTVHWWCCWCQSDLSFTFISCPHPDSLISWPALGERWAGVARAWGQIQLTGAPALPVSLRHQGGSRCPWWALVRDSSHSRWPAAVSPRHRTDMLINDGLSGWRADKTRRKWLGMNCSSVCVCVSGCFRCLLRFGPDVRRSAGKVMLYLAKDFLHVCSLRGLSELMCV